MARPKYDSQELVDVWLRQGGIHQNRHAESFLIKNILLRWTSH